MEKEVKSQVYNPDKAYTWTPEQEFKISGQEFGLLLNSIRSTISTPEAQRIILMDKAHMALEKVLIAGVEAGEIKEKTE